MMQPLTIWNDVYERLLVSGEADDLSTLTLDVYNKIATYAHPLTGVSQSTIQMLADLCMASPVVVESCIRVLVAHEIVVWAESVDETMFALHPRLLDEVLNQSPLVSKKQPKVA